MRKELYLNRKDAVARVDEIFSELQEGWSDEKGCVSDTTRFDYTDKDISPWSGETAAFRVFDQDGQNVAIVGYLNYE